ncbi:MAG: hypothetical protein K5790_05545 [Nitrosopumilus sp.]|nr:hypothetical protein [Nitrosopumilus sp.]MCV0392744.1 hypothetical protein [Nitrosopumilus sp.]
MSTIIQHKYDQKSNQSFSLVELEAKNPASTSLLAMDMMGLSWIFNKDDV